jgi:hypothetical protein
VGKVIVDLAEYAEAQKVITKRLPLKKTKAPFLVLEIKSEWLRVGDKKLIKYVSLSLSSFHLTAKKRKYIVI